MSMMLTIATAVRWNEAAVASAALVGVPAAVIAGLLAYRQARDNAATRRFEVLEWIEGKLDEPHIRLAEQRLARLSPNGLKEKIEEAKDPRRDCYPLMRIPDLYDLLGLAVLKGILEFEFVRALYGDTVQSMWTKWTPAIAFLRRDQGSDKVYEYFDGLNRALSGDPRPFADVMRDYPGRTQRRQARWRLPS